MASSGYAATGSSARSAAARCVDSPTRASIPPRITPGTTATEPVEDQVGADQARNGDRGAGGPPPLTPEREYETGEDGDERHPAHVAGPVRVVLGDRVVPRLGGLRQRLQQGQARRPHHRAGPGTTQPDRAARPKGSYMGQHVSRESSRSGGRPTAAIVLRMIQRYALRHPLWNEMERGGTS
jgi:hypothetical protein